MRNNLTKELYNLMVEGKCSSVFKGTCKIQVDDFSAHIRLLDNELLYSEHMEGESNAVVTMKSEVLSQILANLDKFDLRDPNVLMQVSVEGDVSLAGFLFNLIKRPSRQVESLIKEIEEKCSGYKNEITEIKRMHKPSRKEVIDLIDRSIPFVMTGVIDDWEFLSASLTELKDKYGAVRLRPVVVGGQEKFETMKDFIEKIENMNSGSIYTEGCGLPPAMWSKFKMPFFEGTSFTAPQIWMGSKSGDKPCTATHRDCCNGMLANIFGIKKMIMFSPDQTEYMYTHNAFNTFQTCDVKDVQDVDLDKFPMFANARPIEVTVGPGELLVIPAFWYHCVYAVENVFSISSGMLWDAWHSIKPSNETVNLTI